MDRLTRKELKTDKFATEVSHTVEFLEEHRRQAMIIGAVVIVALIASVGFYYYSKGQRAKRQEALRQATRIYQSQVGPESNPYIVFFPTAEAKNEAIRKAFGDIVEKYPGSDEADIAMFYLGVLASDNGNYDEAIKRFQHVIKEGDDAYASQAALSLAWVYAGQGNVAEGEKLLRGLIEKPTVLVSKEQATIALARMLAPTQPEEARKLLEPLRAERSAVSRAAITALSEISSPNPR
ncbi:MAG: tetratricopeptide repeat protein [Bryobacteraceae bacterium]|nr:tetratricopeptide repeat protein [Bryobacteraceae bacterium]